MRIKEIIKEEPFQLVNEGENPEREISGCFCCDLLSMVIGRAPKDSVWVTVIGNENTIAAAILAEVSCVVLAEGTKLNESGRMRAKEYGVTILESELPVFQTTLLLHERLKNHKNSKF